VPGSGSPLSSSLVQLIDVIQENRQETAALLDGQFQNLARGYSAALSCCVGNAGRKAAKASRILNLTGRQSVL